MPEIPQETRRIQSLLTSLVIVILLITVLVIGVIAYPSLIRPVLSPGSYLIPSPPATRTQTLTPTITLAPTSTRTPHPSLSPTITSTPTETLAPTATFTPPGPPTLMPAQPVKNGAYKLAPWTAVEAQQAFEYMQDYPNTLSPTARGDDNQGYYDAFYFAALAAQEALLRFPEAEQAETWRWNLAYNLARLGDPQAASIYADYLVDALNHGDVRLNELSDWFEQRQPDLRLDVTELKPPPGFIGSYLLEVHGPGSAFIWLLETPSAYQAAVLGSNFDFAGEPDMRAIVSDLDGDSYEEVAYYNTKPGSTALEKPVVYNLSSVPASAVQFQADDPGLELGTDYVNNWAVQKNDSGSSSLSFQTSLFPACPVKVERNYSWTGKFFRPAQTEFSVSSSPAVLSLCRFLVDHAAQVWGPEAAAQIIEALLPDWPPALDENGKPFPADARDEWRFRLGIYYALAGDSDKARELLGAFAEDVANQPASPTSRWAAPAEQFLQNYKRPADIYLACVDVPHCDPQQALAKLINEVGIPAGQDPIQFLVNQGLVLRSSGYFDFDGDGLKERWLTVRHRPLEKLQAWILADAPGAIRAIPVGVVDSDRLNPEYLTQDKKPLEVWIEGGLFVSMLRDPESAEPYLVRVFPSVNLPNRFREGVQNARRALFSGESPQAVLDSLRNLQSAPGLICRSSFNCDEYFYLLGLVNELLGNETGAVDAYLRLWQQYAKSPLTTLARLRLLGDVLQIAQPAPEPTQPTATLLPGFTPVPSPTFTPDLSVTPTLTSTPTPTETPTATPTSTP